MVIIEDPYTTSKSVDLFHNFIGKKRDYLDIDICYFDHAEKLIKCGQFFCEKKYFYVLDLSIFNFDRDYNSHIVDDGNGNIIHSKNGIIANTILMEILKICFNNKNILNTFFFLNLEIINESVISAAKRFEIIKNNLILVFLHELKLIFPLNNFRLVHNFYVHKNPRNNQIRCKVLDILTPQQDLNNRINYVRENTEPKKLKLIDRIKQPYITQEKIITFAKCLQIIYTKNAENEHAMEIRNMCLESCKIVLLKWDVVKCLFIGMMKEENCILNRLPKELLLFIIDLSQKK